MYLYLYPLDHPLMPSPSDRRLELRKTRERESVSSAFGYIGHRESETRRDSLLVWVLLQLSIRASETRSGKREGVSFDLRRVHSLPLRSSTSSPFCRIQTRTPDQEKSGLQYSQVLVLVINQQQGTHHRMAKQESLFLSCRPCGNHSEIGSSCNELHSYP